MKSMLLNGIIGDTYGAPIEMMPHECIMERYGLIKDYITTYKVKDSPYAYTDDSTMTIALIHFFLDNIQKHSKRKMIEFWAKYFEPSRKYGRGTYKHIEYFILNNEVKVCNKKDRWANGGLMRISPLAIYALNNHLTDSEIKNLVEIIHYPTHVNKEAEYTSYEYIKLLMFLYTIRNHADKKTSILNYLEVLAAKNSYRINKTVSFILKNLNDKNEYDIATHTKVMDLDGLMCWQAFGVAIVALISNINKPKLILQKALTYGGDCDTIGSLAGQMSGILYGKDAIKIEWLKNVETLEKLDNLITDFINQ